MAQAIHRLLHLNACGLQHVEHFGNRCVVATKRGQACDHRVELREARGFSFREYLESVLRAFYKARRVCKARVLAAQRFPVPACQPERLELLHLPSQAFALSFDSGGVRFRCDPLFPPLLPVPERRARGGRFLEQPTKTVEKLALRGGAQQRLVLVLAVYVDEELARLAELSERGRTAVDEGARTTCGIDDPPHEANTRI